MNGRKSFTVNSRHIDMMYLFIKDWVDKKELSIVYCSMDLMFDDYVTNTLEGELFYKFRGTIMGIISPLTLKLSKGLLYSIENWSLIGNTFQHYIHYGTIRPIK